MIRHVFAGSPVERPAAAPISLEGLRRAILTPRGILRDEQGWLTHPALPACDEDVRADKFLEAFGIESVFVSMESDVDSVAYDRYFETGEPDCSSWTPTAPDGDGWLLLEIYDTEDGPYALFAREKKPETMRERWKREERERRTLQPAVAPVDERAAFDEWYKRNYPLSEEAIRTGSCDESIHEEHDELRLGFSAGWQARTASANETGAEGTKLPFGVWFSARLDEGTLDVHDRKCAEFVYESLSAAPRGTLTRPLGSSSQARGRSRTQAPGKWGALRPTDRCGGPAAPLPVES